MIWLSRVDAGSAYFTAVALPMVLIGIGQGLAFAPLTAAGIAGVGPKDAGAASGLINAAHQLGGSLGLGILVALAAAAPDDPGSAAGTAERVSLALTGGSVLLTLALIVAVVLVVLPHLRRPDRTTVAGDEVLPVPAVIPGSDVPGR
jgi:hypothetical protein